MLHLYEEVAPARINSIASLLSQYKGKERDLVNYLEMKYNTKIPYDNDAGDMYSHEDNLHVNNDGSSSEVDIAVDCNIKEGSEDEGDAALFIPNINVGYLKRKDVKETVDSIKDRCINSSNDRVAIADVFASNDLVLDDDSSTESESVTCTETDTCSESTSVSEYDSDDIKHTDDMKSIVKIDKPVSTEVQADDVKISVTDRKSGRPSLRYFVPEGSIIKCFSCGENGHHQSNCMNGGMMPCYQCCQRGHKVSDCPLSLCSTCFEPGHQAKSCPLGDSSLMKCSTCKRG